MYRIKIPVKEEEAAELKASKAERKVPWVTTSMAQAARMSRDAYMVAVARESFIYLIYWIILTCICLLMADPYMFWMTDALRSQLTAHKFNALYNTITFDEIRSVSDVWMFLEHHYPGVVYDGSYFGRAADSGVDLGVLYVNKLIGTPTIRQVTVRNNSCTTNEKFQRMFLVCYDSYHSGSMSKVALGNHGLGSPESSAFKWQSAAELETSGHDGRVAYYDGSGFFYKLGRNMKSTVSIIAKLKKGMWVRRETRAIFVETTVYNPHLNLFCSILIVFELPPTGGVLPNVYFRTMKLLRYFTILDHFVLGLEIVFFCYVVYYVSEEIREIAFMKWYYLKSFWTYMDVAIVCASILYLIFLIRQYIIVSKLMDNVEKSITKYNSFASVTDNELMIRDTQAVCLFLATLKLFKFLNLNRTMVHLTRTIKQSAKDVAGFSVMFLLIFVSFAELGYLIFGTQIVAFATFGKSMFTLLRTILGEFDYAEIERAHKVLAPIYFILFIFLVFFVLLNMFLAIINDTYNDVKTEMDFSPRTMEMTDFWKKGFYNLLTDCGCGACTPKVLVKISDENATVEAIRTILKKCGYSDSDIDAFLSKYKIDKDAEVRVRNVSQLIDSLKGVIDEPKPEIQKDKKQATPKDEKMEPEIPPIVPMEEFVAQQNRLDKIEDVMTIISEKLELLLRRLNTLEHVRKY